MKETSGIIILTVIAEIGLLVLLFASWFDREGRKKTEPKSFMRKFFLIGLIIFYCGTFRFIDYVSAKNKINE